MTKKILQEQTQTVSVFKCSQPNLFLNFITMLKNILNLEGAEALKKTEQKSISGGMRAGGGPCGGTGGMVVADHHCQMGGWGTDWYGGKCYACY